MMEPYLFLSYKKATILKVKHKKNNIVIAVLIFLSVMFGLGVDSWRERAISEVRGLRDERGPTQLGIYTRISRDPRVWHDVPPEDDVSLSTIFGLVFLFVIPVFFFFLCHSPA